MSINQGGGGVCGFALWFEELGALQAPVEPNCHNYGLQLNFTEIPIRPLLEELVVLDKAWLDSAMSFLCFYIC